MPYADGEKRYILAPRGLKVGDVVTSGPESDIKPGNALPLLNIPLGTTVHNVELKIGKGGQMVRSAGASAQLMAKEGDYALLREKYIFVAVQQSVRLAMKIMKISQLVRQAETAGSAFARQTVV